MGNRKRFRNPTSAKEVSEGILSTLENRRDQIATRSTICLAAASGLLVLAVQFVFDVCELSDYVRYAFVIIVLVVCIIMCAIAIMTSLDLIKKISRKKHMGRGQSHTDPNLYYFGWIEQQSEDELCALLRDISFNKHIEYNVRQAISLSKNLDYRYKQLSKTYVILGISLSVYVLALVLFVAIKYDIFTNIVKFLCSVTK